MRGVARDLWRERERRGGGKLRKRKDDGERQLERERENRILAVSWRAVRFHTRPCSVSSLNGMGGGNPTRWLSGACVRACVCVVMVIPKVDVEAVCALAVAVWQRATGRERPAEEEG